MFGFGGNDVMQMTGCFGLVIGVLTLVINIIFALGVYDVASRAARNQRLWFAGAGVWALATLFGGVFVAAAFWLMHVSTLAPLPATEEKSEP